jgi:hypothetical protein
MQVALKSILRRKRVIFGTMISLVAVLAWSVGWWSIGTALLRSILGESNSIALAKLVFA